ncbi:MAG TPA: IclR family transcriptional regulator C-terminal domain-containing protein [Solirubrobacteraceae bacterium]|nr:IclR family transcriptional regulator C-terminal domain-containing protein [Solirubrobacteraceae bacterium]
MGAEAEHTAHLLAAVVERFPRTVTELTDVVGVDATPLIEALERYGLVASDAAGVRPGATLRADLAELVQPILERLAGESGETANLIVPRPGGTEAIAQVDGRHVLGATNWIGRRLGLHYTAAGKVFLAFGAASLLDGSLERVAPATITDGAALAGELESVRSAGYATLVDELEEGLSAVGAPVRNRGGAVVAALTVSGATLRLPAQRLALLGRLAVEQADRLSELLGR